MKKIILYFSLLTAFPSNAEMAVMLGIQMTYNFDVGITVKVISDYDSDKYVLALGTSYYPFARSKPGFDLGVGGTAGNTTGVIALFGLDIWQENSYMGIGIYKGSD